MEKRASQIAELWREISPDLRDVQHCGANSWKIRLRNADFVILTEAADGLWIRWPQGESRFYAHDVSHKSFLSNQSEALETSLKAMSTGKIQKIFVKAHEEVAPGHLLMKIESMKMELEIRAPRAMKIQSIEVGEQEFVRFGQVLVKLYPGN